MVEIFQITDYPDYELHKCGDNDFRVWSKCRKGCRRGRYLKNYQNKKGYLSVGLHKNGKQKTIFIHQIVAWIFVENPENKPEVDHIDRNASNNRPANLRWATRREQQNNQGLYSTNTSGVSGVFWHKASNKWEVQLRENGERKYFGVFADKDEAIRVKNREYQRIHPNADAYIIDIQDLIK